MVVMPSNRRWSLRASALYKIKLQLKELSEQKDLLEKQLREMCDYKSTQCGKWLYFKEERKGNVDYKSIPDIQPILNMLDLNQYRNDNVVSWKLKAMHE